MSENIFLAAPFDKLWADRDVFAEAALIRGDEYRNREGRRTVRFSTQDGKFFFLKHHTGIGWKEIFKNLLQFKLPVTGAGNEYHAVCELTKGGVPTMTVAAFAQRGCNPAKIESFIITDELADMPSCEEYAKLSAPVSIQEKHQLIRCLAFNTGKMHAMGINHRDCYLCHFLIDRSGSELKLRVIDLHRAQHRSKVPARYRIKDLAGLYFSSMGCKWLTDRDRKLFVLLYSRFTGSCDRSLWEKVTKAALKLHKKGAKG